jgi:hypothetical protein
LGVDDVGLGVGDVGLGVGDVGLGVGDVGLGVGDVGLGGVGLWVGCVEDFDLATGVLVTRGGVIGGLVDTSCGVLVTRCGVVGVMAEAGASAGVVIDAAADADTEGMVDNIAAVMVSDP